MQNEVVYLYLDDIIPNRFQPREVFDDESLKELAVSIKEHGVIQPIIVRQVNNKYEIIAGERRYKASTMAGLTKIPAIVKNLDDKESSKVALIENLQRRDLTPIEEARTYQKILELEGNMTQEELAQTMGKTQSAVSNKLRLLALPDEVQDALLKEQISERHARSLLNLKNKNDQIRMLERIILTRMTVKELDKEIKVMNEQEGGGGSVMQESVNLENNNAVAKEAPTPYSTTNTYNAISSNPTEVDINKIRANAMDINKSEATAADLDALLRSPEIPNAAPVQETNNFKFVPSMNDTNQTRNLLEDAPNANIFNTVSSNDGVNGANNAPATSNGVVAESNPLPINDTLIQNLFQNNNTANPAPKTDDISPIPNNRFLNAFGNEVPADNSTSNASIFNPTISGSVSEMFAGNQKDASSVVGQIRNYAHTFEKQGYTVNTEELDLANKYQIIINIDKGN